ncbi:hypothetical protein BDV06DRAFT_210634 [Aspergillus oleicola]
MVHLLNLPDEILLLILSNFSGLYVFKSELQALCLVSKRLRSIAQPFLYTQFVREVHCQCCHENGAPPGRIVPLVLFTRTIISRPDLAARVQIAKFDLSMDEFDDEDVREAELDAASFRVLSDGFAKLPALGRSSLFMEATAMYSNPYLLVLAAHMPNLQNLQLTIGEEGLDVSGIEQPYLRNLKSVVIKDLAHTECDTMPCLDYVLGLPQLENFTLINLNGEAEGCPLFKVVPNSLNVSSISLLEACIDAENLENIIEGCKCLKEFNYRGRNYYGNSIEYSCQFEPSELLPILSSQKDNLHTIRCNLNWDEVHPTSWKKGPKYGSFAPFTQLRHLAVDQYPYIPDQEIPASLHCLTIANISFPILDIIGSLNMRTIDMPHFNMHNILPNFEFLTLIPRDDTPNGMLEVEDKFGWLEIYENQEIADEFDFACETLWDIVKECDFGVNVLHEVWERFYASRWGGFLLKN